MTGAWTVPSIAVYSASNTMSMGQPRWLDEIILSLDAPSCGRIVQFRENGEVSKADILVSRCSLLKQSSTLMDSGRRLFESLSTGILLLIVSLLSFVENTIDSWNWTDSALYFSNREGIFLHFTLLWNGRIFLRNEIYENKTPKRIISETLWLDETKFRFKYSKK